ncbi:hypothetical protein BKA62DRAFT_372399 [Auriculariales sp. MPI-PUGE-AT-0066]|nr:hypothetical protein BKA62DRAFT_372399 [Auriculariales sp. MPI-PUGE-AT-0066]
MSQPWSVPDWAAQLPEDEKTHRLSNVHRYIDPNRCKRNGHRKRFLQVWEEVVDSAPDGRYPLPEYLNETHSLWQKVQKALQDIAAATDFDQVAKIIDQLNSSLQEDSVQVPVIQEARHDMARDIFLNKDTTPAGSPYTFVDFASVQDEVDSIANTFIDKALQPEGILHKDTLRRGFPSRMIWHPPPAWEHAHPKVYQHLQGMTIPIVPLSEKNEPDLLLYALGSFQTVDPNISDKLKLPHRQFMLLADTSGAGKTRYIFEYLTQMAWGLYFTFEVDRTTSPYGSADLSYAITLIRDQQFHLPDQPPFVPIIKESDVSDGGSVERQHERWESRWQNNDKIAQHAFTNLLLARMLVYDAFCRAVMESGEVENDALQRAWCLLQVAPHLSGLGDIFLKMFRTVQLVEPTAAGALIAKLLLRLKATKFPRLKVLAIDEAQSGTRTFSTCFGPDSKSQATEFAKMTRPILKPLVQRVFMKGEFQKVIVSGTKIDSSAVLEALASTVAKQASVDRDVAPLLGENGTADTIHNVLDIFFGKGFSGRLTPATRREILFWMQGRHRFLAVMIYALLQAGPSESNVYDILMDLVSKLSGHDVRRSDGPNFPSIAVDNIIPRILRDSENPENAERIRDLETILVNFLLTRRYDRHQQCDTLEKLVEIGVGRFAKPYSGKPSIKVIFNENLILIALWAWFSTPVQGGKSRMQRYLQLGKAAANPSIAGFGWEDVVAYMLWRWFVGGQSTKLKDVFTFIGVEPDWATDEASLVQTLLEDECDDAETPGKIDAVLASSGTTLGLSYQTKTPEETFQAIQPRKLEMNTDGIFQQRGYAFIKPDELMGPDLIAIARLPDGTLLLIVVQCKDLGRKLSRTEILDNLAKLAPNEQGWWGRNPRRSKQCQEYVDAIEKLFPVRGTRYESTNADTWSKENVRSSAPDAYEGHPRCAVLRVIAAPELEKLHKETRIGPWPAAQFSPAAMECTAEEFDSVKLSLQNAQDAQYAEIKAAKDSINKRRPTSTALVPVPTRTIVRTLKIRKKNEATTVDFVSQGLKRYRKSTLNATSSRSGRSTSRSLRSRSASAAPSDDVSISGDMSLSDDPPPSEDLGYSDDTGLSDDNRPYDDMTSFGDAAGPSGNMGVGGDEAPIRQTRTKRRRG